jgi:hypothetical protein
MMLGYAVKLLTQPATHPVWYQQNTCHSSRSISRPVRQTLTKNSPAPYTTIRQTPIHIPCAREYRSPSGFASRSGETKALPSLMAGNFKEGMMGMAWTEQLSVGNAVIEYAMAQPLQNYPSVASTGSANKWLTFSLTASNEPLPAHQDAFVESAALASQPEAGDCTGQLYGIGDWATKVIGLTRDDWVKHGYCRLRQRKAEQTTNFFEMGV